MRLELQVFGKLIYVKNPYQLSEEKKMLGFSTMVFSAAKVPTR